MFALSQEREFYFPLNLLISQNDELFMPQIRFDIVLTHHSDGFRLHGPSADTNSYKLLVTLAEIHVQKKWLAESIVRSIYTEFERTTAVHYSNVNMFLRGPIPIIEGQTHMSAVLGVNMQMPVMVIAWFCKSKNLSSKKHYNPFDLSVNTLQPVHAIARYGNQCSPNPAGYTTSFTNMELFCSELHQKYLCACTGSYKNSFVLAPNGMFAQTRPMWTFPFASQTITRGVRAYTPNQRETLQLDFRFVKASENYSMFAMIFSHQDIKFTNGQVFQLDQAAGTIN